LTDIYDIFVLLKELSFEGIARPELGVRFHVDQICRTHRIGRECGEDGLRLDFGIQHAVEKNLNGRRLYVNI
jgi:hypothetical protein